METSNLRMFLCPFCCEVYNYLNTYVHLCKPAFKGTVSRDFLLLVFFMNQFLLSPTVFHSDRFKFFRKFAEIFASQGAPLVSTTLVEKKISTSIACVVDTGGKFATGGNDVGGKFATSVNGASGNLPPVSTTPAAANLPPV
jgi:hypothetical protein